MNDSEGRPTRLFLQAQNCRAARRTAPQKRRYSSPGASFRNKRGIVQRNWGSIEVRDVIQQPTHRCLISAPAFSFGLKGRHRHRSFLTWFLIEGVRQPLEGNMPIALRCFIEQTIPREKSVIQSIPNPRTHRAIGRARRRRTSELPRAPAQEPWHKPESPRPMVRKT